MKVDIEQPHGYVLDADGRICLRFANWDTSQTHSLPDYADSVEYVKGPAAHERSIHDKYVSDDSE